MDLFTTKYERLLFLGDFNAGMEDSSIKIFCSNVNLTSMINKPACYKIPDNTTCTDLILTNCPGSFENYCVIETGLLDCHGNKDILSENWANGYKLPGLQEFLSWRV